MCDNRKTQTEKKHLT